MVGPDFFYKVGIYVDKARFLHFDHYSIWIKTRLDNYFFQIESPSNSKDNFFLGITSPLGLDIQFSDLDRRRFGPL